METNPPTQDATYTPLQVMMELAAITYASDVTQYLNRQDYATSGWELAWGPAVTVDNANLVYVAKNMPSNEYALAIRGTWPEFNLGLLVQLYEDLDVGNQLPWQYPPTPDAHIAAGTGYALDRVTALASGGQTFLGYLQQNAVPSNASIFVTGHSLGGCVASVVAPWLLYKLRQTGYQRQIQPYTYAAPTAGNTAFATFYDTTFSSPQGSLARRAYNALDLVPMAWNKLDTIKTLFLPPGPACPNLLALGVDAVDDEVGELGYDQPSQGVAELRGTVQATTDFFAETQDQHSYNTYLTLLGAPTLPFAVETRRVTWSEEATTGARSLIADVGRRSGTPR